MELHFCCPRRFCRDDGTTPARMRRVRESTKVYTLEWRDKTAAGAIKASTRTINWVHGFHPFRFLVAIKSCDELHAFSAPRLLPLGSQMHMTCLPGFVPPPSIGWGPVFIRSFIVVGFIKDSFVVISILNRRLFVVCCSSSATLCHRTAPKSEAVDIQQRNISETHIRFISSNIRS